MSDIPRRTVTFRCAHCQAPCGTATGYWEDGAVDGNEFLCRICVGCITELDRYRRPRGGEAVADLVHRILGIPDPR
jgi:hypothetical protein